LELDLLPDELAVCRLAATAPVPDWAWSGAIASVTRTRTELSVICAADAAPAGVTVEAPWRALTVRGPLPFELTGVAAALTQPLADAGVSVLLIATYDTDHVLLRSEALERAIAALVAAGHAVHS
jgi:hypothetical protein